MASAPTTTRLHRIVSHFQGTESKTIVQPSAVAKHAKKPIKLVVTGAAGNIAYSILFMIGQGSMLGADQPIDLRLLDIPPMAEKVKGVQMELNDCAFPVFSSIIGTTDYKTAFQGAEMALLIGAKPRGKGMLRKDLLAQNAKIFEGQGKAINAWAHPNIKVLVVGNPANTNALITQLNAPRIPKENFTAMTRLDQNRAASQVAARAGVPVGNVRNIVIWGNHSATQFPDVNHGHVADFPQPGMSTSIRAVVTDNEWLNGDFVTTVQKRGAAIIKARGSSSAASAANAAVDHMRSWFLGTAPGEYVSMGVPSDGSYGVPKGIVFSFPCVCKNGSYKIVQGLKLDKWSQEKIRITADELLNERSQATGN